MIRPAILFMLLASAAPAPAAEPADGRPAHAYGKPRAPVRIDWVDPGAADRLAAVLVPSSDYERLEVMLIVPGSGDAVRELFDGGRAGESLRLEWDRPGGGEAPRLVVLMTIEGQRLKRSSTPPATTATAPRPARPGHVDSEAGLRLLPATRDPTP
jgi:hypothetical protein